MLWHRPVMRCEHTGAVITLTGTSDCPHMSVKHHRGKKSLSVNAQCGATLKWFKISSSSFSCKCGPQATGWPGLKLNPIGICVQPLQVIPLLITVTDISRTLHLSLFCVCLLLESYWSPLYKIIWDRVENCLITAWSWPGSSHCSAKRCHHHIIVTTSPQPSTQPLLKSMGILGFIFTQFALILSIAHLFVVEADH